MVDFKKALHTGLAADADATEKRAEVSAVIKELAQQVSEATDGAVGVEIRGKTRRTVKETTNVMKALVGQDVITTPYKALVAVRLIEPRSSEELAEFEDEPTGYPVFIIGPSGREFAFDRAALERTLASLLEHPDTGAKIRRLMKPAPTQ